jgi:thiol-disulfide isomerase/thioredoxin
MRSRVIAWLRTLAGLAGLLLSTAGVRAFEKTQASPERPAPRLAAATAFQAQPGESIESINEAYSQGVLRLERQRLERLSALAKSQNPAQAAATYEQLFRLAIAANLFQDAESAANLVVRSGSPAATTAALANLVKIIAEADRGAHEQSLESLKQAFEKREQRERAGSPGAMLHTGELTAICDAYYQRLVHADQFEIARRAFRLALEHARDPAIREFLSSRLKRLDLVGNPAPAIAGKDFDGKPFDLAQWKGKVVLIVFWASWCLPSAAEVESFQQEVEAHRGRGLEVVGINLDPLQDGGQKLETVMPNIRRFLLDHNVRWPNLVNGTGSHDYAGAYGVTDIPANVLIGRDGTVAHVDLVRKNLDSVLSRVVGP